jgi:Uma2 family endonuclease
MITIDEQPKNIKGGKRTYSLEQYLEKELQAVQKHEFFNGKIILMSGGTYNHNKIATNVISLIDQLIDLQSLNFNVLNSDQKIYIEQENIAVYPDALVILDEPQYWKNRKDLITNPMVIVEVLSKSTLRYDRGEKFILYQNLESFKEYVLIDQNQAHAEIWYRIAMNTWQKTIVSGLDQMVNIRSMGIDLNLKDVYKKIDFENG